MHKDDGSVAREHEVRLSKDGADVQAIPEPSSVKRPADQQLGLCIRRPDSRHIAAAGITVMNISQFAGAAACACQGG